MKVCGLWSGHDASMCVLDDGRPIIHTELERHLREKEPTGDSYELFKLHSPAEQRKIAHWVTVEPRTKLGSALETIGERVYDYGHHQSHAAHAFYSSNIQKALILTLDGGGIDNGRASATTIWEGENTKIHPVHIFELNQANIGGLWTRVTRYVFRLQNGWPKGHQAGTVMAMAALGKTDKYVRDFERMLGKDLVAASYKPTNQPIGAYKGDDPIHPFLNPWMKLADESQQNAFDLALGLQIATENYIRDLIKYAIKICPNHDSLCIAGGVALNSVAIGKIRSWFPQFKEVFVPPVPYDGGLCLGAAQYHTHHIHNVPRVQWDYCFPPYLGKQYDNDEVKSLLDKTILDRKYAVTLASWTDENCVQALIDQTIISVFHSRAESGRRALGNRSIIADPRHIEMKDKVNQNVKHRQEWRPFAPSVLIEAIGDIFENPQDSPYMTHVCKFKQEWIEKVPAVVHVDGTARLQTVNAQMSPWWHSLISKFRDKTGIPLLLNTSFNDTCPIVEDAQHAIDCFMNTDIDYLYFPELKLVVQKVFK